MAERASPSRCVFEKAQLAVQAGCALVQRSLLAEREMVFCPDVGSHARCLELHDQLRRSFSFALGKTHDEELTHAQEMRVQCGGLKGLHQVLAGDCEVRDTDGLAAEALRRWGDWQGVPWSEVVHAASSCYKGRHG